MVLKPTQPMRDIIRHAAAGKSRAFNPQHLVPPPIIPRLTGHAVTPNLRVRMLHFSESVHYQVWGWLMMLRGRSSRSRRETLTHLGRSLFRRNWESRNGSGSDVSTDKSSHTASQRTSNLMASTLRAVEHTASKVWRHRLPCEARNHRRW